MSTIFTLELLLLPTIFLMSLEFKHTVKGCTALFCFFTLVGLSNSMNSVYMGYHQMFFIPTKRAVQAIVEPTPHVLGDDMSPEPFPSSDVLFSI